jgi:hypothetical protein
VNSELQSFDHAVLLRVLEIAQIVLRTLCETASALSLSKKNTCIIIQVCREMAEQLIENGADIEG